jgi:hypothetical protein
MRVDAHQNEPRDRQSLSKDQVSEILVFREEQPALALRTLHHVDVCRSGIDIRHVDNLVSCISEMGNEPFVDAFIDEPAHAGSSIDQFFISQVVGSKGLSRSDVVEREPRMVVNNGLGCHSCTKLAQNKLNGHTGPADDRLAAHNLRINLDPLVHHF